MERANCIRRNICPVCQKTSTIDYESCAYKIICEECGEYRIAEDLVEDEFNSSEGTYNLGELSLYLFHHKADTKKMFIGISNNPAFSCITPKSVESWFPKTFAEKIDLILSKIKKDSIYEGMPVSIPNKTLFVYTEDLEKCKHQRKYVLDFLIECDYIKASDGISCVLAPKGLERVYELQKNNSQSKKVFVAMKYGKETEPLREKIREALDGYDVRIMDEIEHNKQIIPEMLKEIRDCRFVVAELSHRSNGAYYEAGYALGMGKEVIHLCSRKASKNGLHFDVAQVNTIIYDSIDDIPRLLKRRVEATIS